jgi:septum site-determining protein MinC
MEEKTKSRATRSVSIRGTEEGLIVSIGEGDWPGILGALAEHLEERTTFLDGSGAIVSTGSRELKAEALREVEHLLSANNIKMLAVKTSTAKTAAAAASLDIPCTAESEDARAPVGERAIGQELEEGLFMKRTVRSGQTVQYNGHVTILGDVNPGGQVVAGGDVVIWGKLRGTVHAGATGDDDATVCALMLAPTQLRIGTHISRSPEEDAREPDVPEIAKVQDNGIVVVPWSISKT